METQLQSEERKTWLKYMTKFVKPGKIVEYGCGTGFVLEALSNEFSDSIIIGIDNSMKRLEKVAGKGFKNVIPLNGDITQKIFPDKTFDTALFVGCLHEVFSYSGKEKVEETLRMANTSLKEDGILIIQDFLKPEPQAIQISFKNEETQNRFLRFAGEFIPRKINFRKISDKVETDIADAFEFISKYRSPSEEDWEEEMSETHFFFTLKEYEWLAKITGFIIEDWKNLPKIEKSFWDEIKKDMEFNFCPEYGWVQLVLQKDKVHK